MCGCGLFQNSGAGETSSRVIDDIINDIITFCVTSACLCGTAARRAGPCDVCEADPEAAVRRLAHLQPGRGQNIPSDGAGETSH